MHWRGIDRRDPDRNDAKPDKIIEPLPRYHQDCLCHHRSSPERTTRHRRRRAQPREGPCRTVVRHPGSAPARCISIVAGFIVQLSRCAAGGEDVADVEAGVDPFRKDATLLKPSSRSFVHSSNPCREGLAAFRLHLPRVLLDCVY
jgi:hypothetical protein